MFEGGICHIKIIKTFARKARDFLLYKGKFINIAYVG